MIPTFPMELFFTILTLPSDIIHINISLNLEISKKFKRGD